MSLKEMIDIGNQEVREEGTCLSRVLEGCYRYLHSMIDYRWDKNLGRSCGPCLVFSETGKTRLASIYGWIAGLAHAGKDVEAKTLARDIFRALQDLSRYAYDPDANGAPPYIIELGDDGTFNGFTVGWWVCKEQLTPEAQQRYKEEGRTVREFTVRYREEDGHTHLWKREYVFSHPGGLLYHGPFRGETWSVSLSERYWSIHT